jgi:hypothetical protein
MPSELKSETARINGAKSRGPITPEGKASSSKNSRRHGLAAASIILPGESAEDFQLLLADYMDQFQPQTGVETDLVEVMAISRWRLRRLLAIETHQFEVGVFRRREDLDKEIGGITYDDRLADAFKHLSYGNALTLLLRYESSINRSYDKALKQLQQLQSHRPVGSFRNPPPEDPSPLPKTTDSRREPRLPGAVHHDFQTCSGLPNSEVDKLNAVIADRDHQLHG